MCGQFPPETWWSVCSGKQPVSTLFRGGQFAPESGGQFDRILHITNAQMPARINLYLPMQAGKYDPGCYIKY
jgi:hypothetical protein